MRATLKKALRSLLVIFARLGWTTPFLVILKRGITEHKASKRHGAPNRPTILGLSPEFFRNDLDVLAESGVFRILLMPSHWQTRMMYMFLPEGLDHADYQKPPPGSELMARKIQLQAFYLKLVRKLFPALGIDAVVSHHIRAGADVDFGVAAKEAEYPYIVMFREGLFASAPEFMKRLEPAFKKRGFWGTRLIVHNESCRDFCVKIGLAPGKQIDALGCLRMDAFARRVAESKNDRPKGNRPKVACFPTLAPSKEGWLDLSFANFYRDAHLTLIKLAKERPDIDVIFKPKPKLEQDLWQNLEKMAAEAGIELSGLDNLSVDSSWDAQDLIMAADVVCGINTTTIMEASLTPKPVVVPFFNELREPPKKDVVKFTDALEWLSIATDAEDYLRLLKTALDGGQPSPGIMEKRRYFFSKYVSDPEGRCLERYESVLMADIQESQARRAAQL